MPDTTESESETEPQSYSSLTGSNYDIKKQKNINFVKIWNGN